MKASLQLIAILSYTLLTLVCTERNIQKLVDDYANWYERRSQEASQFELPTNARSHEALNKTPQEYGKFDFIVIGGGSTGCVIASRLSEIPHWKVLLLEAGGYRDDDYTSVPAWVGLDLNSKFNWGFETVPQKHSLFGTVDGRWRIAKGKGVGGTSLINGLAYSRGDPMDYERWAQLLNDSSWNYENVLPYFKKSENFTRANFYVPLDEDYHGYEGPLHMTQVAPPQQFAANILKGAEQLGYEIVDYNGQRSLGATVLQYYMKDGLRFDPEMGFLAPKRYRRNLKVLDKSYVTKIEFYENSTKVKGVTFTRNNQTYIATIRKEVVLSAGAISSPQILMVSGIGPREHLESFGIPVIKDLPVGKTLLDHTMTYVVFSSNVTDLTTSSTNLQDSIKDLLTDGKGPLTRLTLSDAAGIFKTPVERIENYPDVEFMFTDTNNVKNSKFTEEMRRALNPNVSSPFVLQLSLLHQTSVGTVTLKSSDPFEYPLIDPNLLSDEGNNDIETMYQAIKLFLDLTETDALRSMNVSLAVKELPGCNHTEPLSKDFWYCYIRSITAVGLHEMGTCSPSTNPESGVVDSKLRVFGVEGLRVADASVIPLPVTGHTNAVCTMIGEKVSDFIKTGYKRFNRIPK